MALTPVEAEGVAALVSGKDTGALTALNLTPEVAVGEYNNAMLSYRSDRADGVAVAGAIAASRALTDLRELDLSHRDLGAEGLTELVRAGSALPALRRLRLVGCRVPFAAVTSLAESVLGARLLYLDLRENANLVTQGAKIKKMFPSAHVEGPTVP